MQHLFIHIPKTAGQTLVPIVNRQFKKEECFYIYERKQLTTKDEIEKFKNLSREQHAQIKLLFGHFPFGLHEFIGDIPFTYMTILRDPVKRVLSHYNYVKNLDHHYLHNYKGIMDSLEAYVSSGKIFELDNGQLRLITNTEHLPIGACTEALLEEGIANIDKYFSFVGITENFIDSILLMKEKFNFADVRYVNKNVSKTKKEQATDKEIKLIKEYNSLDIKLYEYCRNKFQTEVGQIVDLSKKRADLELANERYSNLVARKNRLKTFVKSFLPKKSKK